LLIDVSPFEFITESNATFAGASLIYLITEINAFSAWYDPLPKEQSLLTETS
jgi:hypothetical protein